MFTFLLCIYLIRSVFVSRFVLVLCIRAFLLYYFSSFFVAWTRNGIRPTVAGFIIERRGVGIETTGRNTSRGI